jgi:hypothetical protein
VTTTQIHCPPTGCSTSNGFAHLTHTQPTQRKGSSLVDQKNREIIIETLHESGIWFLADEGGATITVPVPNTSGGAFLVEVWAEEDTAQELDEVLFRCGVVRVPDARRRELLDLLNDLNCQLKPFNRWTLAGEIAGVEVRCELRIDTEIGPRPSLRSL